MGLSRCLKLMNFFELGYMGRQVSVAKHCKPATLITFYSHFPALTFGFSLILANGESGSFKRIILGRFSNGHLQTTIADTFSTKTLAGNALWLPIVTNNNEFVAPPGLPAQAPRRAVECPSWMEAPFHSPAALMSGTGFSSRCAYDAKRLLCFSRRAFCW